MLTRQLLRLLFMATLINVFHPVNAASMQIKGIEVENPVVFMLQPGAKGTGSKMTIYNRTDTDLVIDGFSSDTFAKTMLHSTRYEGGKRVMFHIDKITVPAHKQLALTPNTHHFMLFNPTRPLQIGDFVTLSLHTNQGELTVLAQVEPRQLK